MSSRVGAEIRIQWRPPERSVMMTSRAALGAPTHLGRYAWVAHEERWARSGGDGGFFEYLAAALDQNLYAPIGPRIDASLVRVKAWMKQHVPLLVENLADGAPPSRLEALEAQIGAKVPADLREL